MELFFSIAVLVMSIVICAIFLETVQALIVAPFEKYSSKGIQNIQLTLIGHLKFWLYSFIVWLIHVFIFWCLITSTFNLFFWLNPSIGNTYIQANTPFRLSFAICLVVVIFIVNRLIRTTESNIG